MEKTKLISSLTLLTALTVASAGFADGGKAYTWITKHHQVAASGKGWVVVGADSQSDAYKGDADPKEMLPILCVIKDKKKLVPEPAAYQNVFNGGYKAFYHGWSGARAGLTKPVQVGSITSLAVGNKHCMAQFEKAASKGLEVRMAQHHDNNVGGWNFGAKVHANSYDGPDASLRNTCGKVRFIMHIRDQPANPWNP